MKMYFEPNSYADKVDLKYISNCNHGVVVACQLNTVFRVSIQTITSSFSQKLIYINIAEKVISTDDNFFDKHYVFIIKT
jgi:hypothetical protein